MRGYVVVWGLAALLVGARAAEACSPCDCGDATLTAPGVEKPYRNRVRLALDNRAAHFSQGTEKDGGRRTWFLRDTLTVTWSPHSRITVGAALPWVTRWVTPIADPSIAVRRPPGQQVVSGLGDLEVFGRVVMFRERTFAPKHLFWGTLGLKTPTAPRIFDDDRELYYADDEQPGTGSWDPFFGLHYGHFGGTLAWFASTNYRATTANERGYRRGAALVASVAAQLQAVDWAAISLGLDAVWLQPDRFNGNDMPNTGLFTVRAIPALLVMPTMDLLLRLGVEVPIANVYQGAQSQGPQVVLTVAYDLR